jgi:PPOX class probable F420-dependent enzyme
MATLQDAIELGARQHFLVVVSTLRADATIQSSVVNAGVLHHPITGSEVVGFVTYGRAKLTNLRRRPQLSLTYRDEWQWITVEGSVELVGPDDEYRGIDAERLRLLLREIFIAAGGSHDDWDGYDRTMDEQRRAAVLVTPSRIYSN